MNFNRSLVLPLLLLGTGSLLFIYSCASTGYSLKEPHLYNNSFDQVLTSVEKVLESEQMVITNTEKLEDGNFYRIFFFKKSGRINERYFERGHTAEINIRKVEDRIISVEIEEKSDRSLANNEYREHLARDVFKGLKEQLKLIPKNEKPS